MRDNKLYEGISGTVVRQVPLEPHELWRTKVAITLDATAPVVRELLAALVDD